jgi:hypothetical protein
MSIKSQAEVESQYQQRQALVQSGKLSPEHAFGNMEDWTIQLGQRKALLHPGLKQWLWYGRLHDEWAFAGCGVEEAILLSIGSVGGIKKLLQKEPVTGWCVYRQGQELFGPIRTGELMNRLKSQPELNGMLVWIPQATNWLTPALAPAGEITFQDESGKPVALRLNGEAGQAPGAPDGKDTNRRNLIIALVVILIVLCCCLPMVTGGIYFLAKSLGILPAWLGGSSGMALLMA